MSDVYKYTNLSEIESHPEFLRLRQMIDTASRSVWENEIQTKELVAKRIINVFWLS